MAFRFERLTVPSPDVDRLHDVEVLAYTLIEIARIRCERLALSDVVTGVELTGIHGDLGLAGYYASAELESETRHESLALAHKRCDVDPLPDRRSTFEVVFEGAVAAADALADLLCGLEDASEADMYEGPGHIVETHAAHLHVLSAAASLDNLLEELRDR